MLSHECIEILSPGAQIAREVVQGIVMLTFLVGGGWFIFKILKPLLYE